MDEPVPGPIRVLIAEDQVLLRTSFAALAGAELDLEVVGLARLGARDRAQLVIAAYEAGLVRPGN